MEQRPGYGGDGNGVNGETQERRASRTLEIYGIGPVNLERKQAESGADYYAVTRTWFSAKENKYKSIEIALGGAAALAELGHAIQQAQITANRQKLDRVSEAPRQSTGMKP